MEALFVLPDRKLQALLEDLVVARRVGEVGEGVDLLMDGRLFQGRYPSSGCCVQVQGRVGSFAVPVSLPVSVSLPVPVPVPIPVAVPVLRPFVSISVAVFSAGK